jgi:hypothetical protein
MSHLELGRPRTKSLSHGSSITHTEVEDLKDFAIPRLSADAEKRIAALAEEAFAAWAKADEAENQMARLRSNVFRKVRSPLARSGERRTGALAAFSC